MIKKSKSWLSIILLILIGLWAMKALFKPGYYTSHDGWHIVARMYHFHQAISDGQIPPRWNTTLLNNFGYPLFLFTYQLPWWLAQSLLTLNWSVFDAIKFIFIITYIISGLTMFLWIKDMWGTASGLISGALFLLTPYRLANIFVRANLGEAVSFMFIPLIYWAVYKLSIKPSKSAVILGAVALAGITLSHIMMLYLIAVPLGLYFFWLTILVKNKIKFFKNLIFTLILGFGLAGYYWLPAWYYRKLTIFTQTYQHLYRNHFTPLVKLIYSPWGYGAIGTDGEMSRQVGLVLWLVFMLIIFLFILKILKKIFFTSHNFILLVIFNLCFFISIFMMTKKSEIIWKQIEFLVLIDFPWRLLAITSFSGCIMTGWLMTVVSSKYKYGLLIFLLILAIYSNRNHIRVNQYTDIPLSLYIESELTTNTDDEYLPVWVDRQQAKQKTNLISPSLIKISQVQQISNQIKFDYENKFNLNVQIHHMYFPGWQARLDNQPITVTQSSIGGMKLFLSSGSHRINLIYRSTPIMKIGNIISLICLLILSYLIIPKNFLKGLILNRF